MGIAEFIHHRFTIGRFINGVEKTKNSVGKGSQLACRFFFVNNSIHGALLQGYIKLNRHTWQMILFLGCFRSNLPHLPPQQHLCKEKKVKMYTFHQKQGMHQCHLEKKKDTFYSPLSWIKELRYGGRCLDVHPFCGLTRHGDSDGGNHLGSSKTCISSKT